MGNLLTPINLTLMFLGSGRNRSTRRKPTQHGENMQTPHRKVFSVQPWGVNPEAWCQHDGAIGEALSQIEDLAALSELHANKLRLDPTSQKFLTDTMLVVLGMSFPQDFTPDVHLSIDKFLCSVTLALCQRYR